MTTGQKKISILRKLIREELNNLRIEASPTNKMKYYIGERENPQFKKPYYIAYGQLTKQDAKKKENAAYGSITLTAYDSQQEYESEIESLKASGFTVNIR